MEKKEIDSKTIEDVSESFRVDTIEKEDGGEEDLSFQGPSPGLLALYVITSVLSFYTLLSNWYYSMKETL